MQVQQMHLRVTCQKFIFSPILYNFIPLRLTTDDVNCRDPRRFPAMRRATKALDEAIFIQSIRF